MFLELLWLTSKLTVIYSSSQIGPAKDTMQIARAPVNAKDGYRQFLWVAFLIYFLMLEVQKSDKWLMVALLVCLLQAGLI